MESKDRPSVCSEWLDIQWRRKLYLGFIGKRYPRYSGAPVLRSGLLAPVSVPFLRPVCVLCINSKLPMLWSRPVACSRCVSSRVVPNRSRESFGGVVRRGEVQSARRTKSRVDWPGTERFNDRRRKKRRSRDRQKPRRRRRRTTTTTAATFTEKKKIDRAVTPERRNPNSGRRCFARSALRRLRHLQPPTSGPPRSPTKVPIYTHTNTYTCTSCRVLSLS